LSFIIYLWLGKKHTLIGFSLKVWESVWFTCFDSTNYRILFEFEKF